MSNYNSKMNHLFIELERFYENHKQIGIKTSWEKDNNLVITCKNNKSSSIKLHFYGLDLNPSGSNKIMINLLLVLPKNSMNIFTIKPHNRIYIHISPLNIVKTFFNKDKRITKNNFLVVDRYHNIRNLNSMGQFIKQQLDNKQPIYLWGYIDVFTKEKKNPQFRNIPIILSPTDKVYTHLSHLFEYLSGKEAGSRIIDYYNQSKYLLCEKVFDEKSFLNSIYQKGFLNGYHGTNISGNTYIHLAETYQSHDDNAIYQLGFRDNFANVNNDIQYKSFSDYKHGWHDSTQILNMK